MTTTEAAASLNVTRAWVWRLIKGGTIHAEMRGRDWWIEDAEVERYRRERRPAHRPANVARKDRVMKTTFYTRSIDGGHGIQQVIANDGIIAAQSIGPAHGQYHHYTGDGNPELVGQPTSALRGMGFSKLRGRAEQDALESYHNALMQETYGQY